MAVRRPRFGERAYHFAEEWSGSSHYSKPDVSDPRTKCLRSRVVPPRPEDEEPKLTTKDRHALVGPYAMDAIRFYNEKQGTNYQVVHPGHMTNVLLSGYLLHHVDFTARNTDVADAPVEMFFAELKTTDEDPFVVCCKCMGPKKPISGDNNNGCRYCMVNSVQHPRDGGFMTGHHKELSRAE
ncbi:hypothetical protein MKW92_029906 [Papaver armeniacum]|nr:hypothetical protein MKW92_029906 [Papaver armeniacum]